MTQARCLAGEEECTATVDAGTATYSADAPDGEITVVAALPAGSVADADPVLVPTELTELPAAEPGPDPAPALPEFDDEAKAALTGAGVTAGLVAALMTALGVVARRVFRPRDERYGDVAPGLMGHPETIRRDTRTDRAPVAFQPPELLPLEAGAIMDREYRPTHLAATLVHLAVQGAVTLGSKPLQVTRTGAPVDVPLKKRDVLALASDTDVRLAPNVGRAMGAAVRAQTAKLLGDSRLWRTGRNLHRVAIAATVLLFLVPLVLTLTEAFRFLGDDPSWESLQDSRLPLYVGLLVGGLIARKVIEPLAWKVPVRAAEGTALHDQVEGFRQYLATAEAPQLDFEADRDIFRRYLPWAVLFGLTKRWTKVCKELAAQGRIDMDVRFMRDLSDVDRLARDLDRFTRLVSLLAAPPRRPSSSGGGSTRSRGSGSSSGFSGSARGGSGGGGTRAGSW